MEITSVSFFGCSCGKEGDPHYDGAFAAAEAVAQSGRRVVNGGGPGVMLAATMGANEGGGKTTAVYYRPELAKLAEGPLAANHADKSFEESNYILRTKKLLELGDAYIVFNGGTGTISEFGMAWGLARLYFGHHKPLILYGDFWEHLIKDFREHMLIRPEEIDVISIVSSPSEVLTALDSYETVLKKNRHDHKGCTNPECDLLL
ncbi:LOG family protein [Candidatus Kaiserbacteria bacterium]|nr:LOG family protein [Candidatus Kaiserbacteria bacterium]